MTLGGSSYLSPSMLKPKGKRNLENPPDTTALVPQPTLELQVQGHPALGLVFRDSLYVRKAESQVFDTHKFLGD